MWNAGLHIKTSTDKSWTDWNVYRFIQYKLNLIKKFKNNLTNHPSLDSIQLQLLFKLFPATTKLRKNINIYANKFDKSLNFDDAVYQIKYTHEHNTQTFCQMTHKE